MPPEANNSECMDCGSEFENTYYLKKHYRDESVPCTGEVCRFCGRSDFVSQKGRKQHEGTEHDRPYKNSDTLEKLYWQERMGINAIANQFDVSDKTIQDWMERHGIETRSHKEATTANSANYHTNKWGYEVWRASDGERYACLHVHRLIAVAEHGFDTVAGNVVHHENGIKWDNRPENLRVMSDSEHKSLHADQRFGE